MSYTQQSTVWLTGGYNKPHFSSGLIDDIDESALPDENLGLGTTSTDEPGRKIVFANGQGVVKVDRVTASGGTIDRIDWNGIGGNVDTVPGAVDVNFIPGLTGCGVASPNEILKDSNDWDNVQLLFAGGGVAFDGVSACALCIADWTSDQGDTALDGLDWYDGLFMHNILVRNLDLFSAVITNQVTQGVTMNVSFEYSTCNLNNKFDEDPTSGTFGQRTGPDTCIDVNKISKKVGFYSVTQDGRFINDDEAFSEAFSGATSYIVGNTTKFFDTVNAVDRFYISLTNGNSGNTPPTTTLPGVLDEDTNWKEYVGEELLAHITDKTIFITLTRVCSEFPTPGLGVGVCPDTEKEDTADDIGPLEFHVHSDGVSSWYHIGIETAGLLTGQYKAIIEVQGEDRELSDFNSKVFNAATGNFETAVFEEFVPNGSITGIDDEGGRVTFLVDIVEAPAP